MAANPSYLGANAWTIQNSVSQHIPGYTLAEYLEASNEAYEELWQATQVLNNDYFTIIDQVNVAIQQAEFDLRYNLNGGLVTSVHPKIYQISRIRVLQPGSTTWIAASPASWVDTGIQGQQQDSTTPVSTTSPYWYVLLGRGLIRFGRPLPVGATIEVIYTIGYFDLTIVNDGTISSSGLQIVGTGTHFTQLLPPDFIAAGFLPSSQQEMDVEAELIVNPTTAPFVYKVANIISDTVLTVFTAPSPVLSNAAYALASQPDTPLDYHRFISDLATRNMLARPAIGSDTRFNYWVSKCEQEMGRYQDNVIERQHQAADKRRRFPYGTHINNEYGVR